MLDNYIQVFGWKVLIIFLVITFFGLFWGYKVSNTNLNKLTESERLKQIGTGIGVIGFILAFLYSLIVLLIYGSNLSDSMMGVIWVLTTVVTLTTGIFDRFFEKKINDRSYSQFGKMLFWYGVISLIGLIVYYFRWIV